MIIMSSPGNKGEKPEKLSLKQILEGLAGLPRVLKLVYDTSVPLTLGMAFFTVVRGITPLATTVIARILLDSVVLGIRTHTIAPIWLPVILQLSVSLTDRLFASINTLIQQLLQDRVSDRIQLMILQKANTLDLAFFEDSEFYDKLRNAANEASYKPVNMISQTFDLGRTIITLISMLALLLHLSWWLAIIALIIPIPSFIANSRYGRKSYWMMRQQSAERRLMQYYNRVMTIDDYNKEIKLFNLGAFFIERYKHLAEKLYDENRHIITQRSLVNFAWSMLSVMANSGIYLYIALQAVVGRITLGGLTQYTMANSQTGQSFQSLLDGLSSTYENNLFVNTLFEFLEYEPKIVSPEQPVPVNIPSDSNGLAIEFRNVSFTYPGKAQPALKNVSFIINAGETVALVGYNGAGKTTLVKLLTRLYDPDEGEILIGERNIKEYDLAELREHIGVIFQDFAHYHLIVRENIGLGRVAEIENQDKVELAARKSGADRVIEKLTDGYNTMLGRWFKEGAQLSGGEWQKVALARAFMRDARILVLDEPTSALDAQAEYDVFTRFRLLTQGKTALFISHRFSTVRLADRIIVLEHGAIIENGTHIDLLSLGGCYAELFNLQAEAYR